MNADEKYAKLLALSIIYEKDEQLRRPFLERIKCSGRELKAILREVYHPEFRQWIESEAMPIIAGQ